MSLLLGLIAAVQPRGASSYLPAFALGVTLWLFIDASNDALLFDVNSGFSGGWEQVILVGLLATGLLALLAIEHFSSSGRLETHEAGDFAHLFAILAALGIGFHALGEGEAFGSLASSTASGSIIDALGGYGPGISYILHKFLEGVVIGAVFSAYSSLPDQSLKSIFGISRETVIRAVSSPDKTERKGIQTFSSIFLDKKFALRVVYEERKGIIVVIAFYPIKRERYGL